MFNPIHAEKAPLQDHCGIIGAYFHKDTSFLTKAYAGLKKIQTRGYDGAGFWAATSSGDTFSHKGEGMILQVFTPKIIKKYQDSKAKIWVCQTRYGTAGDLNPDNIQPIIAQHTTGDVFCVAHNGQFSQSSNISKSNYSDTYLFAQQLAKSRADNWDDRILQTLSRKRGAYSLLIATKDSLYFARDPLGIRPLIYGRLNLAQPYHWIIASETSAIKAMGGNHIKEALPGSIHKIDSAGLTIIQEPTARKRRAYCIFENIYLMDEDSQSHIPQTVPQAVRNNPNINLARFRSGQILAREAPLTRKQVDFVVGVPGTGISGGQGFANELRLPYVQAIIDRDLPDNEQRTFMQADIDSIHQKVLNHFDIAKNMIKDQRLCLVDDSIVRGNITTGLISLLKNHYQAKEVHVRVVCPPVDKACFLGINTRNQQELIAYQLKGNIEAIRKHIGADSLAYITPKGLVKSLTNDPDSKGFCLGCMLHHQPPIN
jgi:amidophosphoribosyltransferase